VFPFLYIDYISNSLKNKLRIQKKYNLRKVQAVKLIINMIRYILLKYILSKIRRIFMNKYKRANTFKRIVCLVLAGGMILTAFMSMLTFFM